MSDQQRYRIEPEPEPEPMSQSQLKSHRFTERERDLLRIADEACDALKAIASTPSTEFSIGLRAHEEYKRLKREIAGWLKEQP